MKKMIKNRAHFVLLLCILLVIVSIIGITYSRYESEGLSNPDIETALYLLKEEYKSMSICLEDIHPSDVANLYTFSISNNDGKYRAEVNLEYEVEIISTTNLPLEYDVYIKGTDESVIVTDVVEQDEDGTYFRKIKLNKRSFSYEKDETDTYVLEVMFDSKYNDISYQDIIESIEINVKSNQVI